MPKSGTQINAPTEPVNATPHALLLKAKIPPTMLSIIPKTKIIVTIEAKIVFPPNPMSRIM